jgi:hypothetical protein
MTMPPVAERIVSQAHWIRYKAGRLVLQFLTMAARALFKKLGTYKQEAKEAKAAFW